MGWIVEVEYKRDLTDGGDVKSVPVIARGDLIEENDNEVKVCHVEAGGTKECVTVIPRQAGMKIKRLVPAEETAPTEKKAKK